MVGNNGRQVMRPGQNAKRARRGRKPHNFQNRTFDSNGPDVKIRGTASHIYEKYQALARDAHASGDRIGAESYLQHAEHYSRVLSAFQPPAGANGRPNGAPGDNANGVQGMRSDGDENDGDGDGEEAAGSDGGEDESEVEEAQA